MEANDLPRQVGTPANSGDQLAWDQLAWDEEVGWYDPLTGTTDDLRWDWEGDGGWYDHAEDHKEFQLECARMLAALPKLNPWQWARQQCSFVINDFKMWMRNETYYGRHIGLEMRREDRKAQLRYYGHCIVDALSRIFRRRSVP